MISLIKEKHSNIKNLEIKFEALDTEDMKMLLEKSEDIENEIDSLIDLMFEYLNKFSGKTLTEEEMDTLKNSDKGRDKIIEMAARLA